MVQGGGWGGGVQDFWKGGSYVKGVKKVRSEVKLYSYHFSNNVSNDIYVTGIL